MTLIISSPSIALTSVTIQPTVATTQTRSKTTLETSSGNIQEYIESFLDIRSLNALSQTNKKVFYNRCQNYINILLFKLEDKTIKWQQISSIFVIKIDKLNKEIKDKWASEENGRLSKDVLCFSCNHFPHPIFCLASCFASLLCLPFAGCIDTTKYVIQRNNPYAETRQAAKQSADAFKDLILLHSRLKSIQPQDTHFVLPAAEIKKLIRFFNENLARVNDAELAKKVKKLEVMTRD